MTGNEKQFGTFLKRFRLRAGYGLRRFATLIETPASNLSAIEHGRRPMPAEKLETAAEILGLEKGTEEWNQFFDLGSQAGKLPADVQQIAARGFIPALLRTIDNVQLSDADVKRLIREIQGTNEQTRTKSS
jgi:transcriptional regulator with XRE-family HTH domain